MSTLRVSVVILAYGAEEYLGESVAAVLASLDVDVEVLVVDNGCTSSAVRALPADRRMRVHTPSENLGFTGGANLGASLTTHEVVCFVNSDAIVEPYTLQRLAKHLQDARTGIAGALITLADSPDVVNSAGNPLHVLGLSWAGGLGDSAASVPNVAEVASASGACLAIRRDTWSALGGFAPSYFAYMEDMELSWRCWQAGLSVEVLGQARARHHYEFSRNQLKMYLIERNRLQFLLTVHERQTLFLLMPVLLAFELAILVIATVEGWAPQKLKGWGWLVTNAATVRRRRRRVQSARLQPDSALVARLTATFGPGQMKLPIGSTVLQGAMRWYWRAARRIIAKENR